MRNPICSPTCRTISKQVNHSFCAECQRKMKHLTTTQVAHRLNVTRSWVRYLILKGKLPATKLGRDWIVKEQDLDKFKAIPRKVGRPKKTI